MDDFIRMLFCCLVVLLAASNHVNAQCSASVRTYVDTSLVISQAPAYFTSPGYAVTYYSRMNCSWIITASAGEQVILHIPKYYIEGSAGCRFDYLGLYDGDSLAAERTKALCGEVNNKWLFVSSGRSATFHLVSDFSVQKPGFELRYFIGKDLSGTCAANTALSATTTLQYLTSPGFPDYTTTGRDCSWVITTGGSAAIQIVLILLDMMPGEGGCADHLYIYDGSDDTGTLLADVCDSWQTFSDSVTDNTYNTNGTQAYIKYVAIDGMMRRGFLLSYNETGSVTVQTTTPSSTYSTCSSSPVSIDASSTVYVTTPGYPASYSVNINCQWRITGTQGYILQIKVVDFFVAGSEDCIADYVVIYDGSSSSYPQLSRDCGEIGTDVNTTGNTALIAFTSDGSFPARGFKYEISSIAGGTPVCVTGSPTNLTATTDRQYFNSANFPANYDSSSTEQWLIYNSLSSDYEIVLQTIDSRIENSVSCQSDSVKIYQGPCTSYPSLGTFCGTTEPTYVQSNGLYVLAIFQTDSSLQYRGFNMTYYLRKVTDDSLSTKVIVGIIVGVIVGVLVLSTVIGILVYKKVLLKKLRLRKVNASRTSLKSHSSSSSSSSSDSDHEHRRRRHRVKLKPVKTKTSLRSARYILKASFPQVKK